MRRTGVIFPHQLFEQNILASTCDTIYLVEEWLFFKQYNFHKRKISFHRASMKFYESNLQSKHFCSAAGTYKNQFETFFFYLKSKRQFHRKN